MLVADTVLIAALAVFLAAWWLPALPRRSLILPAAALAAIAAAAWGFFDSRWQAAVGGIVALLFLLASLGRRRKAGVPVVSGALLTLLGVFAWLALHMFPASPLPAPSGPDAVGVRTFELNDPSRPGIFSAGPGQPRRLLVRVWYPAQPAPGDRRAHYFTPAEARTTARGMGELIRFPSMLSYLRHARTNAYENAALLPGAGKRPVVVYGHGYMSYAGQQATLMEELASHGYIAYSIQHTYDASDTVFPDGSVAPMDAQLKRRHDAERPQGMNAILNGQTLDERFAGHLLLPEQDARMVRQSAAVWVQDRAFVLDRLAAGAVPPAVADVAAAGDTMKTGQIGMSFGGSTTGGFCMADARCAAGVNLDGLSYHLQTLNADMPVPFLMLHSDLGRFGLAPQSFNQFSYERFETAGSSDHVHRFQVRDAVHMSFSDLILFVRPPLGYRFLGKVPVREMIGLQSDVVRGFFDRYLRGLDNGFPAQARAAHGDWLAPLDNSNVRHWWQAKTPEERGDGEARLATLRGPGVGRP